MTDFSERNLNRHWSAADLGRLSERDLTKLAFRRAMKNAAFFAPAAGLLGLLAAILGLAGKILGWIAIAGFAILAMEPLAGCATGALALVGALMGKVPAQDSDVSWRLLQLVLALANTALYAGLAVWIYVRMNG